MRTMMFATALLLAGTALAGDRPVLNDLHLNIVPRSSDEIARIAKATRQTKDFTAPEPFENNPAGAATVRARTGTDAFSHPSGNISFARELDFKLGNGLFKKLWVTSPSSTLASDGLGPVYNARSCQRCHLKDGRGHTPEGPDDSAVSMFLRLSVPAPQDDPLTQLEAYLTKLGDNLDRTRPEPAYGGQLQDFAVAGHAAEGQMRIAYTQREVPLSGDEVATLRVPSYSIDNLGYGPVAPDVQISPRVAPPMIGLGLLEAIPAADILAHADPDDEDGDGISGKPQIVWSAVHNQPMLGRFGWKAGNVSVLEQSASAFLGDIGISNPVFDGAAGDCTIAQEVCLRGPHGDNDARGTEVDAEGLELVAFYSRNLGVPARRDMDAPGVLHGKQVFYDTGCVSCHTPKHVTHRLVDQPEQSFQLIWPYTDLLLHDMGEGLADNRPEGRASGREWRTPPLWGIGMTQNVNGHTQFLHDGRARSLLEAILWHGGEAEPQRDAVVAMDPADRAALIEFLESL